MGVYIVCMEMPKTCRDCEYCWARKDTKHCDAKYGLQIANDRWDKERASFCPLIEVPEPHGRLIDADALMQYFNVYEHEEWTSTEIGRLINNAITVIERSNKWTT